jgi:hypothetical protein
MNNRWEKQVKSFEWLIDKFWPVPTWPDDWKNEKYLLDFINEQGGKNDESR